MVTELIYQFHKEAVENGLLYDVVKNIRDEQILREVINKASSNYVSLTYDDYSISYDEETNQFTFQRVNNHD